MSTLHLDRTTSSLLQRRPGYFEATSIRLHTMPIASTKSVIAQIVKEEITSLSDLRRLRDHCDTDADVVLSAVQGQLQNISENDSPQPKIDLFSVLRAGSKVHSVPTYLGSLSRFRASRYLHFALARLRENAFSLFILDCNSFSKALRSNRV
jgi:hypothetical protein